MPASSARVLAALSLACVAASVQAAVRGVPPADAAKYAEQDGQWTCLDQTKKIPATYINDDFCDCADGSDEPGTAACSGLSDNKFWCANKGYLGNALFSSRVNDGVCDCCDGSDEFNGMAQCEDACAVLAVEANKDIIERRAVVTQGLAAKASFVAKAKEAAATREAEAAQLQIQLAEMMPRFSEAEGRYTAYVSAEDARIAADAAIIEAASPAAAAEAAAEEEEAAAELTDDQKLEAKAARCEWDGTVQGVVGERVEVDYQNSGDFKVAKITEEKELTQEEAGNEKTFTVKYEDGDEEESDVELARMKPKIPDCGDSIPDLENAESKCAELNSETDCGGQCTAQCNEGYDGGKATYVCGASGDWRPAGLGLACTLRAPSKPRVEKVYSEDNMLKIEFKHSDNSANVRYTASAAAGAGAGEGEGEGAPTSNEGDSSPILIEGLQNDVQYHVTLTAANDAGSEVVQGASAVAPSTVKKEYNAIKEEKDAKEARITELGSKGDQDLGADNEFEGLRDECVETEKHPYTYKFCGFSKVEQMDGGSWTSLGTFTSWIGDDHKMQKFENGQSCWNGPARSVTVTLECGAVNEVLSVEEPETCVYKMRVSSPAACTEADMPALLGDTSGAHDEL